MSEQPWWRGAVIYQIYLRSFRDGNGDGVGDLPGVLERLHYVADLGVDAIWISPFFKSPMADFGYDIADYRDVDPLFGTLADFDRVVEKAHRLGLKVAIDEVLSHTSIDHAWFRESRASRDNAKSDWYVWADAREDGTPPNNWLSMFGGSAWQWEPRRTQYYLHNFLAVQPDLNYHDPEVREAALDHLRFWLDRGIDGFRLDAINFCFHDGALRDNPAKPPHLRRGRGFSADNPYAFQYDIHNITQPENVGFLRDVRALLDRYPGTFALGEISSDDSLTTVAEYTGPGCLHMGYSFDLLSDEFSARHIRDTVRAFEANVTEGWACWAISNHDVPRVASRWARADAPPHAASMFTALACCLRGSACVYQGEELGLPEAELSFEDLRDPYGVAFWPTFRGRDGCRTPMPWDAGANAGFSDARPWLPIPAAHRTRHVDSQRQTADSPLQRLRRFLRWRKEQAPLLYGSVRVLDGDEPVLVLDRVHEGTAIRAWFNTADRACVLDAAVPADARIPHGHGMVSGDIVDGRLEMPAYGVLFAASSRQAAG